jgi:hypothetical protein
MGLRLIFWAVNDRKKPDSIPHGDIDFLFVVVVFDKIGFVVVSLLGGRDPRQEQEEDKVVSYSHNEIIFEPAK